MDECYSCYEGITAASGISAELGIPLTHRGFATGCAFITGHARDGGEDMLDDSMLTVADQHTTLVVYMGLNTLPSLIERLFLAGLHGDTPCAAIERGTTPQQRGVYAQLSELTTVISWILKFPTTDSCIPDHRPLREFRE